MQIIEVSHWEILELLKRTVQKLYVTHIIILLSVYMQQTLQKLCVLPKKHYMFRPKSSFLMSQLKQMLLQEKNLLLGEKECKITQNKGVSSTEEI
jgi:hypothetical protein